MIASGGNGLPGSAGWQGLSNAQLQHFLALQAQAQAQIQQRAIMLQNAMQAQSSHGGTPVWMGAQSVWTDMATGGSSSVEWSRGEECRSWWRSTMTMQSP
jgi:hypothetical protein